VCALRLRLPLCLDFRVGVPFFVPNREVDQFLTKCTKPSDSEIMCTPNENGEDMKKHLSTYGEDELTIAAVEAREVESAA
jgi:hypothetical protein